MIFGKIDNPIGLDISDLSVKMTQLSRRGHGLVLSAYSDVPFPQGLIEHDDIQNKDEVVGFLKNMFKERSRHRGRIKGRSVIASIPESKAFVRVIQLPSLEQEELETAVPIEAEQYIPISIDEMQVDWKVVEETRDGLIVLITASPREYVNRLVSVIKSAGLIPQSIEVESAAIVRALLSDTGDVPGTLILDMDATRTSFIVYGTNSIQFTSSIPIAGNAITDAIAQRLKVEKKEAEHIKRLHGVPRHNMQVEQQSIETAKTLAEVSKAIEPVLGNLFDEIKNTIKFHEQHADVENVDSTVISQIIICGGTAKMPNLVDYLEEKIKSDDYLSKRKLSVELGDAWRNIIKNGSPPFSRREALSYTTALGLALRNYEK